jgi:5-hydroxyisourate hydrolase
MSGLSTHVLDLARGRPAEGLGVRLEWREGNLFREVLRAKTDAEGRVKPLLPAGRPLERGVYRLTFETAAYFQASGQKTFYPEVSVLFEVTSPGEHHHVPLLLSPFGFSTYRGS